MATSIDQIYQETFGRAPDAEGLAYWQSQLAGGQTMDQVQQTIQNIAKQSTPAPAPTPAATSPASSLTWDSVLQQANANRAKNYEGDYLDTTYINGQPAQLRLDSNGNIAGVNWYGVQGRDGYNMNLTPGDNGSVNGEWYKEDNGIPWGALALLAAPFAATALGAGAGAAGAGTADAAGWVSGFDLPMGADLGSMTGAGAGAGLGAGSGWVSGYDLPMGSDLTGMTGVGAGAAAGAAVGAAPAAAGGLAGGAGAATAAGTAAAGAAGSILNPGTIIPALGTVGGILAANQAASAQTAASNAATEEARRQYDLTRADQLALLAQTRADQAPWLQAGRNALGQLVTGTGAGGEFMKPLSVGDVTAEPGYQFGIQQGEQGINRAAAAKGGLYSGATLKALDRFNTDYGATKYNDAWNRVNSETTNRFNRLASLAGVGQTAAQNTAQAGQSAYGTIANVGANTSNNIQNNLTGAGNARASGYVGAANAISNGIGQWYNNQQQQNLLSLLAAR